VSVENIRKLEKLKDDLSDMIIHDLKSPLGTMLLALDILQRKNRLTKAHRKLVHEALRSGEDMMRMIQNLLDINKMEEGKLQPQVSRVEIDRFVVSILTRIRESNMLEERKLLFTNRTPGLPTMIDTDLIQRVLVNLISNAVKHTARGGTIEVRIEPEPGENAVRIVVADDGNGMPAENISRIFEKFEQANIKDQRHGSGIGLTFSRLAVEAHGGGIRVESEVGKGSSFFVSLPILHRVPSSRLLATSGLVEAKNLKLFGN